MQLWKIVFKINFIHFKNRIQKWSEKFSIEIYNNLVTVKILLLAFKSIFSQTKKMLFILIYLWFQV